MVLGKSNSSSKHVRSVLEADGKSVKIIIQLLSRNRKILSLSVTQAWRHDAHLSVAHACMFAHMSQGRGHVRKTSQSSIKQLLYMKIEVNDM